MVPDGWEELTVSDLITGMDAGVSVNSTDQPCSNDEYGILKTSAVSDGLFRPERNKLVDEAHEIARLREPVSANTIVISRMNTPALVGANGYVSEDHPTLFLPDRLWALKADASRADCRWLAHWFAADHTRFRLSAMATGTSGSMKNITKGDVRSLNLLTPPLPEQRKIADILSTWDRAIETSEALLATARTQKRALMQSLLTGKRRFPEFEGQAWQEVRLGDVVKEVKRPVAWSDDDLYRLISVRRRSGGLFHRDDLYGRDIKTKTLKNAAAGDFLISKMQVVHGAMGLVRDEFDGMQISGSYIAIVSKAPNVLNIEFFDWLSRLPRMYHQAYLCSYGVHIEKMTFNFALFLREKISVPPTAEEQSRIVEALKSAESEERGLVDQIEKLRSEKKALMQQLLTGKRRVVV